MKSNSSFRISALAAATALILAAPAASAGRLNLSGLQSAPTHDRFIVKYRSGSEARASVASLKSSLDAAARAVGGKAVTLQSLRRLAIGAEAVKTGRKLDRAEAESLMRQLAADPNVEYVEVDEMLQAVTTPNDTRYGEQWHYFEATGGIKANEAWDTTTGVGVVVAVIDTGITPHSDLAGNILAGYDFISDASVSQDGDLRDANPNDPGDWYANAVCGPLPTPPSKNSSWHGTHVAGTVGAVSNNSKGVAGVAGGAKIVPVRVLGRCGGLTSDIADGIIWASGGAVDGVPANANPAEVINMSLGGRSACAITTQNAINGAVGRGTTVVVAAGNSGIDASNFNPANCANVITVAATDRQGARSIWSASQSSGFGATVDIAAPGTGILSTMNSGAQAQGAESYALNSGTSMAAPHVAGVVALIQAAAGASPKTPAQIETLLKDTARTFPSPPDKPIGAGIVNAKAAVDAVDAPPPPPPPAGGTLTNGTPVTGLSGATGAELRYTLVVPAGASGLKFVTSGGTGDADLYVKFGSAPSTTANDCKSEGSTNAETCNIAAAQAGTYHVLVKAYSAISGVSLTGSYSTGPVTQTYSNTSDYTIRDNATVESPITVSGRTGNAPSNASVNVAIVHAFRGDLKIDLVAPDGSVYLLKNYNANDSANDVNATYTVNLSTEVLNGTWKLRVNDNAVNDVGYINSWSVTF